MSKFLILHDDYGSKVIINKDNIVEILPSTHGSRIRMLNRKNMLYVKEDVDDLIFMIERDDKFDSKGNA